MHFDLGIQGRNLELQELQGRGDTVLHWREYGGIGDGPVTDSGGPQLACVCRGPCGEMLDMTVSAEGNECSQISPPNQS